MDMMTLLYGAAALVGLVALLLLGQAARAFRRKHPAAPPASRATTTSYHLSGLNWMIASTHRSVAQLIGLEMSTATLLAVILSVLCAVAGLILLSWSAMHNLAVSAVAGLATLVLGVLIENISINALKNIRQASEAIRASEEEFYHRQGEHLDQRIRGSDRTRQRTGQDTTGQDLDWTGEGEHDTQDGWTGQGRTEGRGQGNDRADKTGQDNVSRIQAYLAGHPCARQTEIAAALDISTKTVQRALAKLKGTGGTDRQENLRIVR